MKIIYVHGFLGCGKTTLINRIINENRDKKIALLVNECSFNSVDSVLYCDSIKNSYQITSGSIFCKSIRNKYIELIKELLQKDLDLILVETSGYSDPNSLAELTKKVTTNAIEKVKQFSITVVDGVDFEELLDSLILVKRQLQVADLVVLNKIDLLAELKLLNTKNKIGKITKAKIIATSFCQIEKTVEKLKKVKKPTMYGQKKRNLDLRTYEISISETVSEQKISDFLNSLKDKLFRAKGILQLKEGRKICQLASGQLEFANTDLPVTDLVISYSSASIIEKDINKAFKQITEDIFP